MIEKLDFRSTKLQVVTKIVLHMLLDLTSMDLPVESCFFGGAQEFIWIGGPVFVPIQGPAAAAAAVGNHIYSQFYILMSAAACAWPASINFGW